jgi:hypothetical protein
MTVADILTIAGAVALGCIMFLGFRRSNRIPPSGRDPNDSASVG